MPFFVTAQPALLSLTLADGAETLYPRAFAWRNGTQETAIALGHAGLGRYTGVWTPTVNTKYNIVYRVYIDAARTIPAVQYGQVEETWQSLDGAVGPGIAPAVWDELLVSHTIAGSAGEYLARTALMEKIMRNRLELTDGDTANWVLYDDDNVTPLLTWDVTDKDGDPIAMDKFVPARRTRGA